LIALDKIPDVCSSCF